MITYGDISYDGTVTDFVNPLPMPVPVPEPNNRSLVYKCSDIVATCQSERQCHRIRVNK